MTKLNTPLDLSFDSAGRHRLHIAIEDSKNEAKQLLTNEEK